MRRIFCFFFLIPICISLVFGQTATPPKPTTKPTKNKIIEREPTECEKTLMAARPININIPNDDYYPVDPNDIKARVDNFYVTLKNEPTARGVIINYGTDKERTKRRAKIIRVIKFFKYDLSRVEFVRGNNNPGIITKFYVILAEEKCLTPKP